MPDHKLFYCCGIPIVFLELIRVSTTIRTSHTTVRACLTLLLGEIPKARYLVKASMSNEPVSVRCLLLLVIDGILYVKIWAWKKVSHPSEQKSEEDRNSLSVRPLCGIS